MDIFKYLFNSPHAFFRYRLSKLYARRTLQREDKINEVNRYGHEAN